MVLKWNSFMHASLRIVIVIIVVLCANIMHASKEVQKLQSYSAKMDTDRSIICYNFTIGNEKFKEFFTPNYPHNYPNNTECERVIIAPYGELIRIEFRDQFHLEESPSCEYDYLEIRDGQYGYSPELGSKLCGHDFPRDLTSTDRYLYLRFVSDDSIEYSGFRGVYSFVKQPTTRPEPPIDCKFNKTGVSGIISHSEIPQELSNYSLEHQIPIDCMWNITVQKGYKMYIEFIKYGLKYPNDCELNFIDIFSDKLSEKKRLQKFCGTQSQPKDSDNNTIIIRFYAKPEAFHTYFEVLFTAFREKQLKEKCFDNEFDCDDGTCIDKSLQCDGKENCKYKYDEDPNTTCMTGNKGVVVLTSEHMVIILIVFFALVFGMCASITISCWSKIQERRQRKREYKLRRSRDTSVEVGLDRTMTITSLDRGVLEHEIIQGVGMGSLPRTTKIHANTINRKGRDDDENDCYVPDMDLNIYRKQPNGGPTILDDKYSSETMHPLTGNAISSDCSYYYHYHPRDSIRSGSESPIPPPPPPPVLSHMRKQRATTLPLDPSKLDPSPSSDNQHQIGQIHHPDCAQHNMKQLRTNPEYTRSASVPLGPLTHVSVVEGDEQNPDEDGFCENETVPLGRPHRFRAEAVIEMGSGQYISTGQSQRQRSFETTRSAPDVVIIR